MPLIVIILRWEGWQLPILEIGTDFNQLFCLEFE